MNSCCDQEGLISLDQSLALYSENIQPLAAISLALADTQYHVLAEPVYAAVDLPLFTQSAVDGYAIRQQDIDAGLRDFCLAGEVRAGCDLHLSLQPGQAIRIFTGSRLPKGAITVVRQEIVRSEDQRVLLKQTVQRGTDIRYQGEELACGSLLAEAGQSVDAGLLAALAMAGVTQLTVYRQPRIAVIITGDEVSTNPGDAQIFDANGPMIRAWLEDRGFPHYDLIHVGDDAGLLRELLTQTLNDYDLVLTTGGVSVGDYDLIRPLSSELGAREVFWQVAQKPGKPLYFARYQSETNGHCSYLLGLPGNPAAVFVALHVHVQTVMNVLVGKTQALPQWCQGMFCGELKADKRERLLRVQMHIDSQGQVLLHPLPKQQSHMLSNLVNANALVRVAAGKFLEQPALLPFLPLT